MSGKSAVLLSSVFAAGLFGLAVSSASAQGYSYQAPYSSGPSESMTVIAPRFKADSTPLNGPSERLSLSKTIRYTTGDLVDPTRAQVLRWNVWRSAHEVCDRLAEAYPVYTMTSARSCFYDAYYDAISKIDARIAGARLAYWYGY